MTLIVRKPFIRVINVKLHRGMFYRWFLFIMSEMCHVGPYCDSRHSLAWIMTWYILFIIGLLYHLLHACLYDNKYCPFSKKLSFLLISASFPPCLALRWGILSEHCQGLPQHGQPCPLGWADPRPQLLPRSPERSGLECLLGKAFAFHCVLGLSALIKHNLNFPRPLSQLGRKENCHELNLIW